MTALVRFEVRAGCAAPPGRSGGSRLRLVAVDDAAEQLLCVSESESGTVKDGTPLLFYRQPRHLFGGGAAGSLGGAGTRRGRLRAESRRRDRGADPPRARRSGGAYPGQETSDAAVAALHAIQRAVPKQFRADLLEMVLLAHALGITGSALERALLLVRTVAEKQGVDSDAVKQRAWSMAKSL